MKNPKSQNSTGSISGKHKHAALRKRLRQNFRRLTESHRSWKEDAVRRGHIRSYNPRIDDIDRTFQIRSNSSAKDVFIDGVFYKNPVLVHALGVAPIVGAGTSLKNGIALSILTFLLLFPVNVLASILGRNFKPPQRLSLYVILAAVLLIPVSRYLQYYYPNIVNSLGIFLPLVSVSSLISVRAEVFAIRNFVSRTIVDSFATGLGFALVICLVSAIRELLATGAINGVVFLNQFSFTPATMSFTGFMLLGLIAAGGRKLRQYAIAKKVETEGKGVGER